MAACGECAFDPASVAPGDVAPALRSFARRYRAPLTRFLPGEDGDALVRTRPEPGTWSALGYAAHVRDVFTAYGARIERIVVEDRPALEPLDPDARAEDARYDELDPVAVADELAAAAEALAARLEGLPAGDWSRVGLRGGDERSVLDVARGALHEGSHHLLDIGRGLRRVRDGARGATPS